MGGLIISVLIQRILPCPPSIPIRRRRRGPRPGPPATRPRPCDPPPPRHAGPSFQGCHLHSQLPPSSPIIPRYLRVQNLRLGVTQSAFVRWSYLYPLRELKAIR